MAPHYIQDLLLGLLQDPAAREQDLKFKIEVPDFATISGVKVLAGMIVENDDLNISVEQKTNPETIAIRNIPGLSTIKVRWITQGSGKYSIKVESKKGGIANK